ncbi:hypothetical protein [Desulfurobacterium sp.]
MEEKLTREELAELMATVLEMEGFEVYDVDTDEEYKPDFLAVYKDEEVEYQIAIQVEDCQSLNSEEAENRAKAIAEHCRQSGEGFFISVPLECEEEGKEKLKEWNIGDVAELVPIGLEFEEEEEE